MVSPPSAYFILFTTANIFLNIYFHKAAEVYRKTKKLPRWAIDTRTFLENTDGVIKPCEIDDIWNSLTDTVDVQKEQEFDEKVFGQAGQLKFLQLNPTPDNMFDLRDDFEYNQSLKKNTGDPIVLRLNEYRINANRHSYHEDNLKDVINGVMDELKEVDPTKTNETKEVDPTKNVGNSTKADEVKEVTSIKTNETTDGKTYENKKVIGEGKTITQEWKEAFLEVGKLTDESFVEKYGSYLDSTPSALTTVLDDISDAASKVAEKIVDAADKIAPVIKDMVKDSLPEGIERGPVIENGY